MTGKLLKTLILIGLLTYMLLISCFAQDSALIKNKFNHISNSIVKFSPQTIFCGPLFLTSEYRIMIESHLSSKAKFQFGLAYLGKSIIYYALLGSNRRGTINNPRQNINIAGYRLQVFYKHYLTKKDYSYCGNFISPYLSYSAANYFTKDFNIIDSEVETSKLVLGLVFGKQNQISKKIFFEYYIGTGYKIVDAKKTRKGITQALDPEEMLLTPNPIKVIFGINLGWLL